MNRWWICEGPLPEANKFLGPFETQELALIVRSYVERADDRWRGSLWVDEEEDDETEEPFDYAGERYESEGYIRDDWGLSPR